jgi:GNAT superfamily N-acetyltransferase
LADSRAVAVVTSPELLVTVSPAAADAPALRFAIVAGGTPEPGVLPAHVRGINFAEVEAAPPGELTAVGGSFPEPYLTEALAGRAAHFSLLAQADQAVVALASCIATGGGSAELAVLVEDSWQRLGLGGQLLSLLVAHADQSGLARLEAWVLDSQAWVLPVLGRYGICEARLRHGVFEVTVHRRGSLLAGGYSHRGVLASPATVIHSGRGTQHTSWGYLAE